MLRFNVFRFSSFFLFFFLLMYNPVGKCDVYDNRRAVNTRDGDGESATLAGGE